MKTEIVEAGIRIVRRDSLKTGDFFRLAFSDSIFRCCKWISGDEVGYKYTQVNQTTGELGHLSGDSQVIPVYPVEPMQFTYTPSN